MAAHILAPLNDSPAAPLALRYAFLLADRLAGVVYVGGLTEKKEAGDTVVYVTPVRRPELAAIRSEYGNGYAHAEMRTLDMRATNVPIRAFVAEAGVSLVVMGTHERSALMRAVRGTLDDHVVRQLGVPVILIHPRQSGRHIREHLQHVLIPLDGTPDAERAIDAVATIDPEFRLRYTLVEVVAEPARDTFGAAVSAQISNIEELHMRQETGAYLEGVADRLRARGARVETVVAVRDDTGRALIQEIHHHDPDLIAMTTHSRGGWRHHEVGGVATGILHHTTTPVMLLNVSVSTPGLAGVP